MKNVVLALLLILTACAGVETMSLLDEPVKEVTVYRSEALGVFSDEELITIREPELVEVIESAVRSAVETDSSPLKDIPDYDLIISYGDDLPYHPIHLWLGEEGEHSYFMYLVEGDAFYVTSSDVTEKLRMIVQTNE
ncbi:hypothetical protein [Alteribacter aurantiacus]|uniref:hypothetical protein n=1 Tax=Alteribacter aurantiacus TaxID=254410 RepID=UPI000410AFB2|nr:hypothetical protein [Alteribacter aurantiacus]